MVIKRDKIIRKLGDSVGIIFNREEQDLYKLKVGDNVSVKLIKYKGDDE